MKTLALIVALASCEVQEIREVPAAADAAAPVAAILAEPGEARAAASVVNEVAEVAEAAGGWFGQSVGLESAAPSGAALPARVEVLPSPASGTDCSLAAMYAELRLLSGPWGALRRLEAARARGDVAEARRMETKLDELVRDAVTAEGDGP